MELDVTRILDLTEIVFVGVLVFVIGQVILKLVIEPVHQLKRTMADIQHTFVRYAYAFHNANSLSTELNNEVYGKMRQLSGQLYGDIALIPIYSVLMLIFWLPRKDLVYKTAQNLIAIGNWMRVPNDEKFIRIVKNMQTACDNLGLHIEPQDRIPDEHLKTR